MPLGLVEKHARRVVKPVQPAVVAMSAPPQATMFNRNRTLLKPRPTFGERRCHSRACFGELAPSSRHGPGAPRARDVCAPWRMRTALFSVASRVLLTRHYSLPGHESFFRAFSISGTAAWLFLRNRPFSIDGGWADKGEWEGELVGGLVGWWRCVPTVPITHANRTRSAPCHRRGWWHR